MSFWDKWGNIWSELKAGKRWALFRDGGRQFRLSDVGKKGKQEEQSQRGSSGPVRKPLRPRLCKMEGTGACPPFGHRLLVPSRRKSWMLRAGS